MCISYGDRLWFEDADVGKGEEEEGDGMDVLGGICVDVDGEEDENENV